jgi:two-component system OmpR family sensor kinase
MSAEVESDLDVAGTDDARYLTAAVAGVVAGLVFGVMIQFVLERMVIIGAMYTLGEPSLSVGWMAHLVHSAVFGVVYAGLGGLGVYGGLADDPKTGVATGAAFGFALWFVNIGFLWPVWLNLVGVGTLAVPYHFEAVRPLVGHLVWGGILGVLFPLLGDLQ